MKTNDALKRASGMPELRHKKSDPFDIMTSEVAEWLVSQPEIRSLIFDLVNDRAAIIYDQDRKTWRGNPEWKPKETRYKRRDE